MNQLRLYICELLLRIIVGICPSNTIDGHELITLIYQYSSDVHKRLSVQELNK